MYATNGLMIVFLILSLSHLSKSYAIDLDSEEIVIQACGPYLAKLIQLVCNSTYARPYYKRFLDDIRAQSPRQWNDDYEEPSTFLKSSLRNKIYDQELSSQEIGRRQVSRDCCAKPCTLRTVKLYCGA